MGENQTKEFFLGVDLGGTKILTGVFDYKFDLKGTTKLSTKASRGVSAVIERIARCVREAVDECDLKLGQVRGVGVGAPGAGDTEAGRVIFAPTLPSWTNLPLTQGLEKRHYVRAFLGTYCN